MTWTEGRLKGFIQSALRKSFSRFPAKYETLKAACVGKKPSKSTGRMAYHYKCAKCRKLFTSIEVQVDHKEPVIDVKTGFVDWNNYVERLFCSSENLQVLCKTCHAKKSAVENTKRRKKNA